MQLISDFCFHYTGQFLYFLNLKVQAVVEQPGLSYLLKKDSEYNGVHKLLELNGGPNIAQNAYIFNLPLYLAVTIIYVILSLFGAPHTMDFSHSHLAPYGITWGLLCKIV